MNTVSHRGIGMMVPGWKPAAGIIVFAVAGLLPAEDGEYQETGISDRDRQHWSFRPVQRPAVPVLPGAATPIDSLLLLDLLENGIDGFAPMAKPETLLRRLTFDLTGLPPTPEQRKEFFSAWRKEPQAAMARMIDELLDSPHYGERWAQHWLDVARFADTDGFEHDKVRENAWKYRDWVVQAFNQDLPYDRFLAWQIAGDEMAPENPDAHLATGFLLSGPDMPDINLEAERRHNVLNELTSTVGAAFLGLTMECAQCHDHKSDPISQADFYRLRTFFEGFSEPAKNKSLPHVFTEKQKTNNPIGRLMIRGDFRRPGIELAPAFLRVVTLDDSGPKTSPTETSSGRRTALARWLIRPDHPLTSRVIVNRVWQHHFGRPLVETPSDFGKLGDRPSHPELLDWLAGELVREKWSLKSLHRKILLSNAWQQASKGAGRSWERRVDADPENRLLSRQNRRRLSGEELRDAMLLVSGRLNRKAGGPGVRPPLPPEVTITLLKNQWPVTEDKAEHDRRSIYLFARRNLRYPMFDVFDRPDGNQSCARRHVSTTAPQSLTLLNDPFVHEMAAALGDRIQPGPNAEAVGHLWLLALARRPSVWEREKADEFLETQSMDELCLAIFNLSEFVYLD